MSALAVTLAALAVGASAPAYFYGAMQLYQLSGYRAGEFFAAVRRKRGACFLIPALVSAAALAVTVTSCVLLPPEVGPYGVVAVVPCGAVAFAAAKRRAKVALAFTPRLWRFMAVQAAFAFALAMPAAMFLPAAMGAAPLVLGAVAAAFAHVITSPIERRRNARFVARARDRLAGVPLRVGITGSYGKTTAKNILLAFLSEKYRVCATPGNFNTPMGIARTAYENLADGDELFLAEMGARHKGDIAELASLVRPGYGMITAIGTQHLETFGSQEAIAECKNELVLGLAEGGTAVFNGDNDGCLALYDRCEGKKHISGRDESGAAAVLAGGTARSQFDCFYGGVKCGERGTEFTLVAGGRAERIVTPLVGGHVPSVIAECAALAMELGISLESIKKAASGLKPVAHRLELLYNGSDVIIDDAYNANESGARAAVETLRLFAPRTRVLVTPGIVELGARQRDANFALGMFAADKCDYAIFVGPNAAALYAGAAAGGMDKTRLFVAGGLNEAMEILKTIKGERAVLFENDLPDNY